ncbi:MAG: MMPL family transporter [Gemmataceae bacterium]|nr:MMPL family transporter [Gemmataceae bacterium]
MFRNLGSFTVRHPWLICALWLLLGTGIALVAPPWESSTQDDDVRFVPDRFTSVRAYKLLEKAFPQDVFASKIVFAVERNDRQLDADDYRLIDQLVTDLEGLKSSAAELKIAKIESCRDGLLGFRLVSPDQQCTLIMVSLETPYLAAATSKAVEKAEAIVKARLAEFPQGPQVFATGAAGIGRDLGKASLHGLDGTTWATIILVVVVLLAVYRAPLLALIPLATIALSVWVSLNLLACMTQIPGVHLVNISKIFAIVILYGAGTDYCLFLISRYREELNRGREPQAAIARAVGGVGEALAASAGTVMVGLGMMAFAEFAKVRYAGPAIACSLGVALVASLTLTPALLRIFGRAAFWPGRAPMPTLHEKMLRKLKMQSLGFWDWVSRKVAARPALVWGVSVLVLLPLVLLGLKVQPNYRATGELSPNAESLQGLAAIQRHFEPGEVGPITVLLTSKTDWETREGMVHLKHLSRGFARLPNVAEVRSLPQPLGVQVPEMQGHAEGGWLVRLLTLIQPHMAHLREEVHQRAKERFLAKVEDEEGAVQHVARLDVVLKSDPFDAASTETLTLIETWLREEMPRYTLLGPDVHSECYGVTATARDLAVVTESDRHRVNGLVLAAIFVILFVLVRRFWMTCYLLVTVLASYFASLGATMLFGGMITGQPMNTLDWRVPFFLFTILIAVGEDYNILLISRAIEETKRYGSVEGMRRALAKTGGAITSCGLIMAGTFATLMFAGLNTLVQIGFALAFGVLIDTFLVRPFLAPAFAMLFWHEKADPKAEPAKPSAKAGKKALRRILGEEMRRAA